jgi:hypothetical protein
MFAYSSINHIFLQKSVAQRLRVLSLVKAPVMPTAPKTPATVAPKSPTQAKAGAPTSLSGAEWRAELEEGNLESYAAVVAKHVPAPPPVNPKGMPVPCPEPVAFFKPPPAEVLAERPVRPEGTTLAPSIPIQFAKSP